MLFSEAGPVQSISIPVDRDTGRPRGFAFVEFADQGSARQAIDKFDGYEMKGRTLRVNIAENPKSRDHNFGGGGSSFGGSRGYGGGGGGGGGKPKRPKGSRRNIRAQKRGY